MRKIMRGVLHFFLIVSILAFVAIVMFLSKAPVFGGERQTFYTRRNSSSLSFTDPVQKLFSPVEGESAFFEGDRRGALEKEFSAELLFTEQSGDVLHFYYHSPVLGGGLVLQGKFVNLHIAVGNGYTVVGSPVIFGSI